MQNKVMFREEFLKAFTEDTYTRKEVMKQYDLQDELKPFTESYVMVTTSEENGKTYLEHARVFIGKPEDKVKIICSKYRDNYTFFVPTDIFQNLLHYDFIPIREGLKTPNSVKVLSQKKVNDWVMYCTNFCLTAMDKDKHIAQKKQQFKEHLNAFKNIPGVKFVQHENIGYITTDHFEFSYQITQNYIEQKIRITKPASLELLEKLVQLGL